MSELIKMKQETNLRLYGTSLITVAMILVTLLSGLPVPNGIVDEVSAGGGNFAGGNGTSGDPYQIEDILDLQNMSSDLSAHYVLINDIDASATRDWSDGKGFEPVGDYSNKFTGSLDGSGYKITGLFINRTSESYVGLLGYAGTSSSVSNVSLEAVSISGNVGVGGLLGVSQGIISNCHTTGNVSGDRHVGGVVGYHYGTVENCTSTGKINGNYYIGGVVGYNYGLVENCTSNNKVNGKYHAGGLVGRNDDGTVENCTSTGNVTGDWWNVGGFVGTNSGRVENCYSTGRVSGDSGVGGLVGNNDGGKVENSYATGNVSGNLNIGALVGTNDEGTIENSFYCIDLTAINGKKTVAPYGIFEAQFEDWIDDRIVEINDYLQLIPGTEYYEIEKISDLKNCLPFALENYKFRETADINLSAEPGFYLPVFNAIEYDGNGYSIFGLNLTLVENKKGFFGMVGYNSKVTNITLTDSIINGYNYVGSLVGYNHGIVENCTSASIVDGYYDVGGLVGYNFGMIENCSTTGNASGYYRIGGLVGSNDDGTVENSCATGNVNGDRDIGGLVGYNDGGTIEKSWTTGNVSGSDRYVGGLIGYNSYGIVENCYATSDVIGNYRTGGLIGWNQGGSVQNCHANSIVSGKNEVGGFVGDNSDNGVIEKCYTTGNINGDYYVGGFLGSNSHGTVKNCYATSNVSGNNRHIGGFVGSNRGTIMNNFATGNVSGYDNLGGLVGFNWDGTVEDCYSRGNINGTEYVGGLIGYNAGSVKNCFATGNVSGHDSVGGLVGLTNNAGTVNNSFWDVETSGMTISDGGTGKNTTEMMISTTFTNAKWDFNDTWDIFEGKGYPFLRIFVYPMISTQNVRNALEDQEYYLCYHATVFPKESHSNPKFEWRVNTSAEWLSMSTDGVLIGTPINHDVGTCWVNVSVSLENGYSDHTNFTITVENTNDRPEINFTPQTTIIEDLQYFQNLTAVDIDPTNDTLTWQFNTSAGWLELNDTMIKLEGTPTNEDVGTFWANISVSDGNGGLDHINFTLTVENTNDPPVITFISQTIATEDTHYSLDLTVADIDPTNDIFTWQLDTSAEWLELNTTTHTLQGIPINDDVGYYWVNVSVSDGNGGLDYRDFTLMVENTNDPPEITFTPLTTATEDVPFSLQLTGMDIDSTNDTLEWIVGTNIVWLDLNTTTTTLVGTPSNYDVGTCWVNASVSDGIGGLDYTNFTITVENTNDPPEIFFSPLTTATEDKLYSLTLTAADIDPTNDSLTWSVNTNAGWLELKTTTLAGTPTNDDLGTYWVNLSVSDGNEGTDFFNYTLTVENTNDRPVIQTTALPNGTSGQVYGYDCTAIDVDGDSLAWSMETNGSGLTINSTTGTLQGTPSAAGIFWVNISVEDGNGGTDSINLTITILPDLDDDENQSFLFQKIGPLPLYASFILVIIGLVAGISILKNKRGKFGDESNKPENSQ